MHSASPCYFPLAPIHSHCLLLYFYMPPLFPLKEDAHLPFMKMNGHGILLCEQPVTHKQCMSQHYYPSGMVVGGVCQLREPRLHGIK